jgi:hypothetical protein
MIIQSGSDIAGRQGVDAAEDECDRDDHDRRVVVAIVTTQRVLDSATHL